MVYVNCAARHGGVKTAAPRMTPRQIDEARSAAAEALAEARHPETGKPLFPQIIETAEAYQIDPTREGYPDLIALPDEPYWVRTKLTSSPAWVEPDPNLPGTHRPEGIVALSGAGPARRPPSQGQPDRRHAHDPRPARPPHPGPHRGQADRRSRIAPTPRPASPPTRHDPAEEALDGPHRKPFEYTFEEQEIIEQRLAELGLPRVIDVRRPGHLRQSLLLSRVTEVL